MCAVFVIIPSVKANLITNFTFSYGTTQSPINVPWNDPITLPLLNIRGGTLQSVTFNITSDFYITNQISNYTNSPIALTRFKTEYTATLDGAPGSAFSNALDSITIFDNNVFSGGPFTLAAHTVTNLGIHQHIISPATTYSVINGDDLSVFTNAPSLLFSANMSAFAIDQTSLGESAQLTYEAAAMTFTVTYNYTETAVVWPTPEPSAGILLGVGGLACCGWRLKTLRRRKRSQK